MTTHHPPTHSAARIDRPTPHRRRKSLGQHFLADGRIAQRIVAAAALSPDDTVVEIGPGSGLLTRRLLPLAGRVIAVELDAALANALPERTGHPNNLTVIPADARTLDLTRFSSDGAPYKLVANLPYYAAAPILRRFLTAAHPPTLLVIMVQREVAAAMCAAPGEMTLLSVATQFYARPTVVTQVPARAFRPPPRVSSTVVKLTMHPVPPAAISDIDAFFALIRSGFATPRKQIANSLHHGAGCSPTIIRTALNDAGLDPRRRPATLTIPEWAALHTVWPPDAPRTRQPTATPT